MSSNKQPLTLRCGAPWQALPVRHTDRTPSRPPFTKSPTRTRRTRVQDETQRRILFNGKQSDHSPQWAKAAKLPTSTLCVLKTDLGPQQRERREAQGDGVQGASTHQRSDTDLPGNGWEARAVFVDEVAAGIEDPAVMEGQQGVPRGGRIVLPVLTVRVLEGGELIFTEHFVHHKLPAVEPYRSPFTTKFKTANPALSCPYAAKPRPSATANLHPISDERRRKSRLSPD